VGDPDVHAVEEIRTEVSGKPGYTAHFNRTAFRVGSFCNAWFQSVLCQSTWDTSVSTVKLPLLAPSRVSTSRVVMRYIALSTKDGFLSGFTGMGQSEMIRRGEGWFPQ